MATGEEYLVITPCSLNKCMLVMFSLVLNLNFFSMPDACAAAKFSGGIVITKCTVLSVWYSL